MAYHETYSDIVPSDAAVYYAGSHSSSSSESSSAAVDAPCGLGPPVDTGLWRAPTAPPLTQLSANQRQAMSLASATFPSIHHHLASMHAEIDTSQANLIGQAAVYDQPSSNNACEAYLPQGWQIPNHATSVFAQAAQAAGLNYSSADLYLQNAHIPGFALSHAQGYEARFEVNTDPRQISAILAAGHQRKHAFVAEGSSPYEHQGEPTQVLHNAAPLLRPAQDHGPLVWARRDGDLHDRQTPPEHPAQMAHRQGATLHPRMTADVTSSVAYPATLDLSSAIPLKEQHYDNSDGTISYLVPQHSGPSADDPSPDAFARSTLVQRPDLPWFHEHCPYLL
ncbi:hypothetical protein TRAPUB_14046 [Trametes pubescens]|uniref:Uncharacterized protein n=1 Tax=Trametes pubescens TaxID=154538 RepID=A0A1M2VPK4_TRAPU|nr:hypothetical protein TRAPUB_14046 [Trametes pubescens]